MTDPVPTPLRADAERNRQRLVDAARELFAERGLDVTLDDIARHAGVGTGTAYRRFPNKDALIEALMVERIEALAAIARECLADPDPWNAFAGYFERALELMSTDRGLKEVLFSSGRGAAGVAAARQALVPVVSRIVRRAVNAGVLRDDFGTTDVPLINFMLNTLVDIGREHHPELYRRYLAIVLDGLRPRREAPTPLLVRPLNIRQYQEAMASWTAR